MKFIVDLNGARHEVTLDGRDAVVDGESISAQIEEVDGTPVRVMTLGSEVHRVVVRRGSSRGSYTLWVDGHRFEAEALDERTRAIRDITAKSAQASGPAPVVAPMPGLVVRVQVAVGDLVQAGQGLVVMEAMKMENELRASASGRVKALFALPGAAVEKGALLVELEDPAPSPAAS
ncbi:MAG TPA: biotin/lipoyl-containing protein [Gemmatimonadaceae bacterium]|nr:biotin/lipoyl-containing protein [Gemmatimonadaceae bacterium]